ncbi:2-C-methyl-D-erythritol 4-phosphate cytidylyltransferase [Rubrivirga sp. S365]|uniref:2-C-methyl-D-erythritol 4-phosphate cytidylyltransferase n=1 Tax=Rubrivirga litoralis TaxID=3075598 RepID=A0ABU3BUY4_9BACT|nr:MULTISPECIES: 2-C-methyl-D-erythritol 4-phosphate cytidylyltransferase [unclassified Rubrivirga]MDT0633103.1 2-C-methyl-D-erythritol 4-phosphate cytidylyltransferase [Rubrivirga sp. F394]MDT7857855.1 2-C-methyl-D-erythritol 4-phosphate cytidylyltransferase [Rubrivirga sp. S365]
MTDTFGVVLPAGGAGRRMGGDVPKQFRLLGGAPVLVQTLRAFARHPALGAAVVVVPAGEEAAAGARLREHGAAAAVVAGGPTRQASVANGVAALPADVNLVLVHDAVRPFVSADVVSRVVAAARAGGAAAAAVPVADTLRQGGAGPLFGETVPRDGLWAMQTPQGARRDWLVRAHANAGRSVATDEVGLLQGAGYPVRIVEGDARNLKLTRPSDWALAEALWPAWMRDEG